MVLLMRAGILFVLLTNPILSAHKSMKSVAIIIKLIWLVRSIARCVVDEIIFVLLF